MLLGRLAKVKIAKNAARISLPGFREVFGCWFAGCVEVKKESSAICLWDGAAKCWWPVNIAGVSE
jgi:hypothetical protein